MNKEHFKDFGYNWHTSIKALSFHISLVFISISVFAQTDQLPNRNQKEFTISSNILKEKRSLWIYTPSGYETSEEKYPVLYLLDPDQNFAYVTELERFLSDRYRIPKMIIIGIVNTDRIKDFTPIHSLIFDGKIDSSLSATGGGKNFLSFLKTELIPYVEKNYRTQSYRILEGHSLGGLFALYCKEIEPELFQSEIIISPAIYGGNMEILGQFSGFLKKHSQLSGHLSLSIGNEPGGILAVDSLVYQLKHFAPKSLKWHFNTYMNEDHFSVGYKSMYDGLRFIYSNWFINTQDTAEVKSYRDIEAHFKDLSVQFGYEVKPDEDFLNEYGYQILNKGYLNQATEVFLQNVKNHPNSANAYDSLAEAYFKNGDFKRSLDYYKKSISLNPKNENGKEMIKKILAKK